jgi:F-type H+-transporting ATPase subunit b
MVARWIAGIVLVGWLTGGSAPAAEPSAPAPAASQPAESPAAPTHAAGGHAAHDPYDLSHANASPALEDPSAWRYDMSLCTLVVFLLLLALLARFAWSPIMTGLDNREKSIVGKIEEAKRSAEQAAAELQAYRNKLAAAAQEALEIVNRARQDAEEVADQVRAAAQADATRARDRAIADIHAAKNIALREVARKGADLAVGLAGRIVRRELKPADHVALISEALQELPSQN